MKSTAQHIEEQIERVRRLLLEKNAAYGDSALDPVRVFSRSSAEEQIRVRIDDKLSRIVRGSHMGEDVILDLIGYLVLLLVSEAKMPKIIPAAGPPPKVPSGIAKKRARR